MHKFTNIVGIDMSKLTFDACFYNQGKPGASKYKKFKNSAEGYIGLVKWLKKHSDFSQDSVLFSLENAGIYTLPICFFFESEALNYSLIPGAEIKMSAGIQRGKTDKIDALIIAEFALSKPNKAMPTKLPSKHIIEIQSLLSLRERLLKAKTAIMVPANEAKKFDMPDIYDQMILVSEETVKHLKGQIKGVEKKIEGIIDSQEYLVNLYDLVTSVPGVGKVIAWHMIVATRGFTTFEGARQFACHAGIAPFPYESGTSVKRRSKVSKLANKKLKTILSMGARSAIRNDPEMKLYALRKIQEGKNMRLVNNNVRNKLVQRVFAVIKRNSPYVVLKKHAA
jgi:transposase